METAAPFVGQLILVALLVTAIYGLIVFSQRGKGQPGGKVNWSPLESVGVTIAVYVSAQVAVVAILMLGALATGNSPSDMLDRMQGESLLQFVFLLGIDAITVAMIVRFMRTRLTPLRAIGIVKPHWKDISYTSIGFVVYFVLYLGVAAIIQNWFPSVNLNQEQEIGFSRSTQGLELIPVFLSLVILPPIAEELLARGVLYSGLRTRMKMLSAGLVTSALFAVAHLPGGTDGALLWVGAIDTFILSMVLVYVREKRGSLWPPMFIHGLKNFLAFFLLFIVKI